MNTHTHVDGQPDTCIHGRTLDTQYCGECMRSNIASERPFASHSILDGVPITGALTDEEIEAMVSNAMPEPDMVNSPPHYTGEIECIDAMTAAFGEEVMTNYCVVAAFKYIWRHKQKNGVEDIKKAIWYLRFATGDDPRGA